MRISRDALGVVLEHVYTRMREGLIAAESPLLEDDELEEGLRDQVRFLIGATFSQLGFTVDASPDEADERGTDVGVARAAQHVHPAESLQAARLLFSAALPSVRQAIQDAGHSVSQQAVAVALSDQIFRLLTSAALSYVGVLLNRITAVQREERVSIARDLHDRVAHTLASGLMKLDLADSHPEEDGAEATRVGAHELLHQALGEAQTIAMELRQVTGSRSLRESVELYLAEAGIHDIAFEVSESGEPRMLRDTPRDQVFLIIREALRNSFAHAQASVVGVHLNWDSAQLTVDVWDDGRGFSPLRIRPGAMGLVGMRERSELIGASFVLGSTPGDGTRIVVEVPYAND
ncbi:sensor histidine kinase [Humibacter albus]|uniref:sensor histidine kinase n=1 Tax=Humibacter albus TaxID=427754 RepID=UPI0003B70192|nr:ATP-binding protein [Humibacter albus]